MDVLDNPLANRESDSKASHRKTGIKVLCIDDDPHVVNGLVRNLQARGVTTLSAKDGMQGFGLACSESPDVIITDMLMPRGDGDYLVECLKSNAATRNIPVIVLSGVGTRNLERMVAELAVEGVFSKPVKFESLYRAICALT